MPSGYWTGLLSSQKPKLYLFLTSFATDLLVVAYDLHARNKGGEGVYSWSPFSSLKGIDN
ncbi:MAG: hypothetical protein DMG05_16365 [Acidobacteria bacterium]|nr:MAG: hypothetical protein DMG05_16365 [Acidobacteriota bacterium]